MVAAILGLAILLVNTGDCVNLAFADAKAAECCLKENCPLASAAQMDSCCNRPVSPAKYIQTAPQQSTQRSVQHLDFPADSLAGPILKLDAKSSVDATLHAPPSGLKTLFTPLLI
ncbi:MAG: hypothetical protein DMG14_05870 [Acidobacteria bacterium]|nr:MAG: hypothetical protein DMG14_05870 [Acidobacteriota bacterium]